mgnify:CR=1 FL=1
MTDLARTKSEAARLLTVFESAGATPVECAILQPAETLLDLYGEDIRARAYVTSDALRGEQQLGHSEAYAQSKLALTIWSQELAREHPEGPMFVSVNPGSLLATKMVKESYGMAGNDLRIGADILRRAAVSEEFANASGQYYDNDAGRIARPHPAAADRAHVAQLMAAIRELAGA